MVRHSKHTDRSAAATTGAAGTDLTVEGPERIRNVALVGPSGAGKTTLIEAMALTCGAVARAGRVEDGTSLSDHDDIEHRRHRSVQVSVVPVRWRDTKINLIDTPGYADFVGDLRAGLRAADAALFVVSAADGPEALRGATPALWQECAAVGMPRAIVLTHLDNARIGYEELIGEFEAFAGGADRLVPLHLPVYGPPGNDGHRPVTGMIEPLPACVTDYSSGRAERVDPTPDQREALAAARERLVEAIIAGSEDETLMDRYLAGEPLDPDLLTTDLERAVAHGGLHPVLFAAPAPDGTGQGLGTLELLDLVVGGFPTPREHEVSASTDGTAPAPLACDPDGALAAEVIRTSSDPYVGRVSLVRVFSGTLHADDTVHVRGRDDTAAGHAHDADERIGAVTAPFGGQQRPLAQAIAGDIACVTKLAHAETGDTLSDTATPRLIEPWPLPDPLLPVAIRAHGKADEDKLAQGLARLTAEDPSVRLENNPHTGQLVLWCLGEAHRDVALERLRERFGVRVDVIDHEVELRETLAGGARARGRHVKQSGGHGQYAVVEIEVAPLPRGAGIEFADAVVGGAVPRQYIASVEKGVRAQAGRGVASGHPLVDVRVTLVDGKAHSVDSSDAAFQTAGALALREAADAAGVTLLEPYAEVRVVVDDESLGQVLGDLSGRRGRVLGTEPDSEGRTRVRAEVPERELGRYAVELRSLSHGTGVFDRRYARHEPMPPGAARTDPEARS